MPDRPAKVIIRFGETIFAGIAVLAGVLLLCCAHRPASGAKAAAPAVTSDQHVEEKKAAAATPGPSTPVHILSKPTPVYTDEARELKLEGEVLLEVNFGADGKCEVLRLLKGLGHGLDEAAQRAAEQIRFTPATRNGQPVDQTATIHVVWTVDY
jgi:TonB family protein